jgi:uncharacterized membrane protein YphA (DoxX/SURF4 family)
MNKGSPIRIWAFWISRVLLGGIFIYAAIEKLGSPQDFADGLAAYRILPSATINLVAWGLPLFELGCGLFLLTGIFYRIGALGVLAMLAIFTAALLSALVRGLSIHCGCFGAASWLDSNPWVALVRDALLLLLAAIAYQYRLTEAPRREE